MKIDRSLLEKFYANECTEEEYAQVRTWMNEVSEDERDWVLSELARRVSSGEVKSKTSVLLPFSIIKKALPENKVISWPQTMAAAALWLLFVAGFLYRFYGQEPVTHTLISKRGAVESFVLPDSTRIWLNAGSSLSYTDQFGDYSRHVTLEGEAFFDVTHNPNKPFVIATSAFETKVVGTSFNISAYPGENTSVTVASGKVKVQYESGEHHEHKYLTPGQSIVHYADVDEVALHTVEKEVYAAWRSDKLIFDQQSLRAVFSTLERRFDKVIVCEDSDVRETTIRSSYEAASLPAILEDLKFIASFDYQLVGDTVLITPNP
ncbi:FecR family protein [Marinoscillum furvescens]|nr:FecR domain-containing protein [Marinoscillum furvescens]